MDWGVAARPLAGQSVSGDLHAVHVFDHSLLLAVIDGVGHGREATAAAQRAAAILGEHGAEPVIALVRRCHEALAKTRGAVMTLASVNVRDSILTWLGVGNVEARLFRADANTFPATENLLLRGGLVGLQLPALHASVMPLSPGDLLVFATDGLHTGFDQRINLTETPQQIADGILERHYKGLDDALILAARYLGPSP
ncbi:MAG: SpoIIE family protein phosphatase [Verrucomicrobiota bacterium]|nr:SpoIIE family protein phosphatase [Verrucomicrobiota bacterium]